MQQAELTASTLLSTRVATLQGSARLLSRECQIQAVPVRRAARAHAFWCINYTHASHIPNQSRSKAPTNAHTDLSVNAEGMCRRRASARPSDGSPVDRPSTTACASSVSMIGGDELLTGVCTVYLAAQTCMCCSHYMLKRKEGKWVAGGPPLFWHPLWPQQSNLLCQAPHGDSLGGCKSTG